MPSRYAGRLLMLSTYIIGNKISQDRVEQILYNQTPLLMIMQEAYNVADDVERDILRKLRFLMLHKKTDSDDDNDSKIGQLEAMLKVVKDKYSLLYGAE